MSKLKKMHSSLETTGLPLQHGNRKSLHWAVVISIGFHVFTVWILPLLKTPIIKPPVILNVEILLPKPLPPSPVLPDVEKQQDIIKPKIKPTLIQKPTPQPQPTPTLIMPTVNTPPPIEIMSVVAKPELTTALITPTEVPSPIKADLYDQDSLRKQYGALLSREIVKYKQYPRIAEMRGWQGVVEIDIQLDGNGSLITTEIHTSSGYELLDNQALEMVKKASPMPTPPEGLRNKIFKVMVPISFRLR